MYLLWVLIGSLHSLAFVVDVETYRLQTSHQKTVHLKCKMASTKQERVDKIIFYSYFNLMRGTPCEKVMIYIVNLMAKFRTQSRTHLNLSCSMYRRNVLPGFPLSRELVVWSFARNYWERFVDSIHNSNFISHVKVRITVCQTSNVWWRFMKRLTPNKVMFLYCDVRVVASDGTTFQL